MCLRNDGREKKKRRRLGLAVARSALPKRKRFTPGVVDTRSALSVSGRAEGGRAPPAAHVQTALQRRGGDATSRTFKNKKKTTGELPIPRRNLLFNSEARNRPRGASRNKKGTARKAPDEKKKGKKKIPLG